MTAPDVITVAHSPDADDAFMFYALAREKLDTEGLRFEHVLKDIESLNRDALEGRYHVTAVSFHAYASLVDRYLLLPHGASMGDRYGPMIVAAEPMAPERVAEMTVAIPGEQTTAALALRLFAPAVRTTVVPFDQIPAAVTSGTVAAGVIIHESQVTYAEEGLHKVLDLGEWWDAQTGLPLPLGGNAIRRDLDPPVIRQVSRLLRASIAYALAHREEALAHAMQFGRGLTDAQADRFVGMYVNDLTMDYGDRGRRAVQELYLRAHGAGIIPRRIPVEFVTED